MNKLSLQMDSDETQVCLVAGCIRCYCKHHMVGERATFEIVTCVMEAINNVLEHALPGRRNQHVIVVCGFSGDKLLVEIIDKGLPMVVQPALKMPAPDSEHGRGWHILRRWMDEIDYRRRRGENRLRMKKEIFAAAY